MERGARGPWQDGNLIDGRLRTASTMAIVAVMALAGVARQGGFHLPDVAAGWWGLALLTLLYGTGFTIMFTVLPRLGVVGNSAIMNVEPVFALGAGLADPRPGDRAVAGGRGAARRRDRRLARLPAAAERTACRPPSRPRPRPESGLDRGERVDRVGEALHVVVVL